MPPSDVSPVRFSKLFMAHLASEFEKQDHPQLQSLIRDQVSCRSSGLCGLLICTPSSSKDNCATLRSAQSAAIKASRMRRSWSFPSHSR